MNFRGPLFVVLVASHAAVTLAAPDALAPALAGAVYLPLMVLHAAGVPVFVAAASGGWSAPSLLGWVIVGLLWLAVWWGVASVVSRLLLRRGGHALFVERHGSSK